MDSESNIEILDEGFKECRQKFTQIQENMKEIKAKESINNLLISEDFKEDNYLDVVNLLMGVDQSIEHQLFAELLCLYNTHSGIFSQLFEFAVIKIQTIFEKICDNLFGW